MSPTLTQMQTSTIFAVQELDRRSIAARVVVDVAGLEHGVLSETAKSIMKLLRIVKACPDSRVIELPEIVQLATETLSHVYYDSLQLRNNHDLSSGPWPQGQKSEAWKVFEKAVSSLSREGHGFFKMWKQGCNQQQAQSMAANVQTMRRGISFAATVFKGPESMWTCLEDLLDLEEPTYSDAEATDTLVPSSPFEPIDAAGLPPNLRAELPDRAQTSCEEHQTSMFEGADIDSMEEVQQAARDAYRVTYSSGVLVSQIPKFQFNQSSGIDSPPVNMFKNAKIGTIRGGRISGRDDITVDFT